MASIDIHYFSIFILLWFISIFLYRFIYKKPTHHHLRLPPSPPEIPLLGHIHHLSPALYQSFHRISSTYGPLLFLRLGSYRLVLVSSSSFAAEIFKTHDVVFASRPDSPLDDSLVFGDSGFFTAPHGDYWRFMKKLCMTELLGSRQLQRSRHVRREELTRFLRKIMERTGKGNDDVAVDLGSELMALTNNSTCSMAFSMRCSGEDNEAAEMCRELVTEYFGVAIKTALANLLGPLKKLGFWVFGKDKLDVRRRYDEVFEKLMKEHQERAVSTKGIESDQRDHKDKDLLDILMEYYYKDNKDVEFNISLNQMKSFFAEMFIAGTSTSADAMQWAMAELINHPDAFNKLREEIESVTGRNCRRLVEESDIPNLPYLQAVIKETFRLHPPIPAIPRACREECQIGGFDVPKDTVVVINAYSIMRDPEIWEDPNEFKPERFMVRSGKEGEGEEEKCDAIGVKGQDLRYIPSGGGRRVCPGANLGYSLVQPIVAAMVQCFDWKVEKNKVISMRGKPGFNLSMAHPLLCFPLIHYKPIYFL